LRLLFALMIAIGGAIVWFAPQPPGGELNAFAVQIGLGTGLAGVIGLFRRWGPRSVWWNNHTPAERVRNFVTLLGHAKREVVIVTGSLHSGLYGASEVIAALRALPKKVRIRLYHTSGSLDPRSSEFLEELAIRHVPILPIDPKIPHGMVVDRRHTKIERHAPDDAEEKFVDYDMYNSATASRIIAEIVSASREICGGRGL